MSTNARVIDVAIAAVTLLNSGPVQATFGAQTFTAVRGYRPTYDLKAHKAGLKVTVIPAVLNESPFLRLTINSQVGVDVGVQNFVGSPVAATQDANCDALMLLVEQIKQVLELGLTLPEAKVDCGWQATENDPIFFPDHLREHNVFTSVPRFTYLTRRTR
jgi:hypothetical protein